MNTDKLLDLVKRYYDNRDYIKNEDTAKLALVVPFIRYLGYDPNNPREVRLEYRAEFTQGDGKRFPDAMDFAIFDQSGTRPLMVIETKPLGTNLRAKSQQLARYIGQMTDLHFGIITDGCHYLFYGDLDEPNQMDREPFFQFSLNDANTDWAKVAKFLSQFSRDKFNAETLVTEAENSRYRQAMIEKIVSVLRAPAEDVRFMKWLTKDIYKGHRTSSVMARLGSIANEAIEPALLRVMSDDFLEKLKERLQRLRETGEDDGAGPQATDPHVSRGTEKQSTAPPSNGASPSGVETTQEELALYEAVREMCERHGYPKNDILYRDTQYWFNVSYRRPTKWFLRFLSGGKRRRKRVATRVPAAEARQLVPGFEVREGRKSNISAVVLNDGSEIRQMENLVMRSLELLKNPPAQSAEDGAPRSDQPPVEEGRPEQSNSIDS